MEVHLLTGQRFWSREELFEKDEFYLTMTPPQLSRKKNPVNTFLTHKGSLNTLIQTFHHLKTSELGYFSYLRVETTKSPKVNHRPCVNLFSFTKVFILGEFQDF